MNAPAWLNEFANPPLAFRPVPFWSWNETMETAEVRRQCRIIHEAGWGGVFLHARVGLRTEYLGEAWFEACAAAIDECKKIGLKVWLYDEEGWPSGISGGTVPLANEENRQKVLFARPVGGPAPAHSVPVGPPQNGLQIYHWTAPLGSWRFNGACYADLLSRAAMATFLDDAYAGYHRRFGADYGTTIVAEFLDEPCTLVHVLVPDGTLPYTPGIFDAFLGDHGYDIRPQLHLLFQDGPDAERIRVHYSRTASRLFEINFTKQLADWCGAHGIALTGHYMEGGLYDQQCKGNCIPQNYRHQQIPGIDHLCMQVAEIVTAKQCHGVVNQYAKPRMLCETYGAAGQNLSFGDRWWIGLHLLSLGVTLFNPHLSLFTMAGCRKRDFPPNLFFQQPWWPANRAVDEPLTRLCVALSQGRAVAEALLLHPQESAAALCRVRTDWPEPAGLNGSSDVAPASARERIQDLEDNFQAVITRLLGSQRVFDLGDETILRDVGAVERDPAGRPLMRVGAMTYPAVILPAMVTVAESTFRLLREFLAAGGPVLLAGEAPTLVEGRPSLELDTFLASCTRVTPAELPARLATHVPPLVRVNCPDDVSATFVQVRDLPDSDRLVFFADRRRAGKPVAAAIELMGDFTSVHHLDPVTGEETLLASSTKFSFILRPTTAHLLRLTSRTLPAARASAVGPTPSQTIAFPGDTWRVERVDDNALTLDNATWREASFPDFTPTPIPVVAIQGRLDTLRYTGPLALRYRFQVAGLARGRKVHLIVEYAERYRITVNGDEVRSAGLPPFLDDFRFVRLDISSLVSDGENTIELHLAEFIFADNEATRARQPARTGTEIEAIYLVGDFHVATQPAPAGETGPNPVTKAFPFAGYTNDALPPSRLSYVAADSLALVEPAPLHFGDVVSQGLPFYAGRLRLTTALPVELANINWQLQLDSLDAAVAAVATDGHPCGYLFIAPLRMAIRAGTRSIELTLFSTLRNLLGPHHHDAGEPVNTAPWYYLPFCGDGTARADNTLAWARGAFQSPNHRASYACVSFGHIGGVSLRS